MNDHKVCAYIYSCLGDYTHESGSPLNKNNTVDMRYIWNLFCSFSILRLYHLLHVSVWIPFVPNCTPLLPHYMAQYSFHPQTQYQKPVPFFFIKRWQSSRVVFDTEPLTCHSGYWCPINENSAGISPKEIIEWSRSHHSPTLGVLHWERQLLSQHPCLKLLCSAW